MRFRECIEQILEHIIKTLWGAFLVVGIPLIIYCLIGWSITRNKGEELTVLIIILLYWIAWIFIIRYRSEAQNRTRQIRKILTGTMDEKEKALLESELRLKENTEVKTRLKDATEERPKGYVLPGQSGRPPWHPKK